MGERLVVAAGHVEHARSHDGAGHFVQAGDGRRLTAL